MCTRFTTVRVDVIGSSHDVGFDAAGQHIGLMPGGMPKGTTSPVGDWHVADIGVGLTVGGPTNEPQLSVFTLGVEAL